MVTGSGICCFLRSVGVTAVQTPPRRGNHLHLRVCKWPLVWFGKVCYIYIGYGEGATWYGVLHLRHGKWVMVSQNWPLHPLTPYTTDGEHWIVNESSAILEWLTIETNESTRPVRKAI